MGKIISARLATDDYDPMNLLGTSGIFSPKKQRGKDMNKKNKTKEIRISKKLLSDLIFALVCFIST